MSISEFVQSPGYKKTMGKVYGLGAAVVILGALWKILHLPGASIMLIAGLGTEAIIFALSAFEPPHEMPDWSLVYPELVGLEGEESVPQAGHASRGGSHGGGHGVGGGGSELAALVQSGNLEQKTVDELVSGVKKLANTTSQMADLSDASVATQAYLNNMKVAGESVQKLSAIQANTFEAVAQGGNLLAESYQKLGDSMKNQMTHFESNHSNLSKQMSAVGQNLSSINSAYELQLNGLTSQVQATQSLNSHMKVINEQMAASVEGVKVYKEQIAQLSKSVSELNTIYGNMLSAINTGK
jgi:hypothetical protein